MTREEKKAIVDDLKSKLAETDYFYITDASGMTVAQTNAFRRACFEKGIEYRVVKNSLIKKALESSKTDYTPFNGTALKGFSGILFSPGAGNLPAKLLKEFRKKNRSEKPLFKGASIDSSLYIGENQLDLLVNLKSKNEVIGDVIGLLQSPAKNVISALQGGGNKIAGIVKTLSEREQ